MMRPKSVTVFFMVVFTVVALLMARLLFVFVGAIMLAGALASLSLPVHKRIERALGRKKLAAGITTGLIVFLVVGPLLTLVVSLSQQAYSIYLDTRGVPVSAHLQRLLESDGAMADRARRALQFAGIDTTPEGLVDETNRALKSLGFFVYERLRGVAANAVPLVFDFVVMTLLVFTFLTEGGRLKRWLMELSPLPAEEEEQLFHRFALIGRAVFLGNGLSGVLQGALGAIGFVVVGLGHAVLWGTVMGFLALLPIVGASAVFVPAAIWLALQGQTGTAIAFLAYNLVYVGLVEYVLKPKLIGGSSRMNAVFVFISILAGLNLFGLLGLFYGPLFVAMFLALADLYLTRYRASVLGPEFDPATVTPDADRAPGDSSAEALADTAAKA